MIKLIALDLDNTLLNTEKKIDPKTLNLLRDISGRGIQVVLATGRATATTAYYAGLISEKFSCVSYNGSINYSIENGRTEMGMLSYDLIKEIINYADSKNIFLQLYHEDVIVVKRACKELYRDPDLKHISFKSIGDFKNLEPFKSPKAMMVTNREYISDIMKDIKHKFGNEIEVTQSEETLIEILPSGISKMKSLKKICDEMDISSKEVLAIGDNLNDIEMVKWAGYGCSVNNAIDELKKISYRISTLNDSKGVYELLKSFFDQRD